MSGDGSSINASRPAAAGGYQVGHKRLFRIYRDETLMVRRGLWQQESHGNQGADADLNRPKRAVVSGLRLRPNDGIGASGC